MIAAASAVIDAPGVLRSVRCAPPLTIRQVISERDATCALCLVGSAAGPLPGDDLTLQLSVHAGASATLVAAGATIAQGRASIQEGPPARLRIEVDVAAGAHLDADPGALIVCAGARVDVAVVITLAPDASLRWREVVVLGRTGEPAGAAVLDWDVRRDGTAATASAHRSERSGPSRLGWSGR